jgi:hypothetical protein
MPPVVTIMIISSISDGVSAPMMLGQYLIITRVMGMGILDSSIFDVIGAGSQRIEVGNQVGNLPGL